MMDKLMRKDVDMVLENLLSRQEPLMKESTGKVNTRGKVSCISLLVMCMMVNGVMESEMVVESQDMPMEIVTLEHSRMIKSTVKVPTSTRMVTFMLVVGTWIVVMAKELTNL